MNIKNKIKPFFSNSLKGIGLIGLFFESLYFSFAFVHILYIGVKEHGYKFMDVMWPILLSFIYLPAYPAIVYFKWGVWKYSVIGYGGLLLSSLLLCMGFALDLIYERKRHDTHEIHVVTEGPSEYEEISDEVLLQVLEANPDIQEVQEELTRRGYEIGSKPDQSESEL